MLNVKNFHKDAILIQQRKYVQMKMFVVNIKLINKMNVNLFYKLMVINYVYMIQLIKYVERNYVQII